MFHYFQNFSLDDQHFDDFCHLQKSDSCEISGISDYYDHGIEGDLFKLPEPIIEPPFMTLDHMTSATSMFSCAEDAFSQEVESFQSDNFLSDLLNKYKETSSPLDVLNDSVVVQENAHPSGPIIKSVSPLGPIMKSVSSDDLGSVDGVHRAQNGPSFVNFTEMDLKTVYGTQRTFCEGYIKPQIISDHATETRMQKLSRYHDKKTKRNFSRKIKEGISGRSATDQRTVCQNRRNRCLEKVIKCF